MHYLDWPGYTMLPTLATDGYFVTHINRIKGSYLARFGTLHVLAYTVQPLLFGALGTLDPYPDDRVSG